ncbi:hypothetical protein KI387_002151, partial [Taxus chinensis]
MTRQVGLRSGSTLGRSSLQGSNTTNWIRLMCGSVFALSRDCVLARLIDEIRLWGAGEDSTQMLPLRLEIVDRCIRLWEKLLGPEIVQLSQREFKQLGGLHLAGMWDDEMKETKISMFLSIVDIVNLMLIRRKEIVKLDFGNAIKMHLEFCYERHQEIGE